MSNANVFRFMPNYRPFSAIFIATILAAVVSPLHAQTRGCNSGSSAQPNLLNSERCQATATTQSVAIGPEADATGNGSAAFGDSAVASGITSSAFGFDANARGDLATALGAFAGSSAGAPVVVGGTSIGASSFATASFGTAIGASDASTTRTTAGFYAVAIGGGDNRVYRPFGAPQSITVRGARATGNLSIAIGTAALSPQTGSVAVGLYSRAQGGHSAAYGENSRAAGARSISIGAASEARAEDSVAIGSNSVATAARSVSVGAPGNTRRIMNVARGTANNDAVNVAQLNSALASFGQNIALSQESGEVEALRREVAELRAIVEALQSAQAASAQ